MTNREKSFHNTITVEIGLIDYHKMTVSVLNTYVPKQAPVVIKYRDCRKFDNQQFRHDLPSRLADCKETCYEDVKISFKNVLNKHAPMKSKSVRANNSPFMNKTLSKAMTRSRLKNKFQNNPTNENKSNYNRQHNCVNLNKKIKKAYYSNLNIKDINDKKFWDVIKHCFSDKNTSKKKIVLIDENITDDKIAKTMNDYFSGGGGGDKYA